MLAGGHHSVPSPAGRETTDDEDDVPAVGSVTRFLATGNEVNDDHDGATGDDNEDNDGDGNGAMGSGATGYNDVNDGDGQQQDGATTTTTMTNGATGDRIQR